MEKLNKILMLCIVYILLISCTSRKNERNETIVLHNVTEFISKIDSNEYKSIKEKIVIDFNINDTFGNENITLLDYAIEQNKEDLAIYLMSKGIDVNHVDSKGTSSFTKAIGNMTPNLLDSFLQCGLDYEVDTKKNMNYFVYMLYKKDYLSALTFIKNQSVLDFFKTKENLFIYLIYYWDSNWSSEIGNYLIENDYLYDNGQPYFFYAIDEFSLDAIKWLDSIGIQKSKRYDERYECYMTPYEYAENKLFEMINYLGKDYKFSQEDAQISVLKNIIDYLKE